ncbi:MAG: flagellin [Wujia sp.]
MIITHNLQATNINTTLNRTAKKRKKTLEKLSSGYKVNRSADDAAGLSISEKMRNQIRGLNQAVNNSEDGVSLIQTAEGALGEMSSIIRRMRELSVQGANDVNSKEDRDAIQDELDELKKEIDRISDTTAFNNRKLLNGELGEGLEKVIQEGKITFSITGSLSSQKYIYDQNGTRYKTDEQGAKLLAEYLSLNPDAKLYKGWRNPATHYKEPWDDEWHWDRMFTGVYDRDKLKEEDYVFSMHNMGSYAVLYYENVETGEKYTPDELKEFLGVHVLGDNQYDPSDPVGLDEGTLYKVSPSMKLNDVAQEGVDYKFEKAKTVHVGGNPLYLQVGANAGENMSITINAMNVAVLGISNVNVSSHNKASDSIQKLDEANKKVSGLRSELGAKQNRLEFTINNLSNYSENLQSAESGVRDTDMAEEMVSNSKENILLQVAQAMLAQANQNEQSVLSLLQG